MKKQKLKISAVSAMALGALMSAPGVFAAPYNMEYSGGAVMGSSHVTVDSSVSDLVQLLEGGVANLTTSGAKWETGYINVGQCHAAKFFRTGKNNNISSSDNLVADLSTKKPATSDDKYIMSVKFNNVQFDDAVPNDGVYAVAIDSNKNIHIGYNVYSSDNCASGTEIDGVSSFSTAGINNGGGIYLEMNSKLYKKSKSNAFISNDLYFAFSDIDAEQSYKILNSGNALSKDTMVMEDASTLQRDGVSGNNYYVGSEKYIYSTYPNLVDPDGPRIYVPLSKTTQQEGLKMVFGGAASTGLNYFVTPYKVTYKAENGTITGQDNETVNSGDNPSGSTAKPNTGYSFVTWRPNVAVTLENGTTKAANTNMTAEEILNVVVDKDVTFTAYHTPISYNVTYVSDKNGKINKTDGIESETKLYNQNPTGSSSIPNQYYEFSHWTTNQAVIVSDGTVERTIPANSRIDDLTKVLVRDNITFTAHHTPIQYVVKYISDKNGEIDTEKGLKQENRTFEQNPTGSTTKPNDQYRLVFWQPDVDVVLTDKTIHKAGEPLTPAQVKKVKVTQNITFKAVHEKIKYTVEYKSDPYGDITGDIIKEKVPSGENPSGSEDTPKPSYQPDYWVADVNVTLEDGTVIKAGEPIKPDQIKNVVVKSNIVFTAIHKKSPAKPNTGEATSEGGSALAIGLALPIGVVTSIVSFYVLNRRRLQK